mmetsp:Transcript_11812/g.18173  ORF Transcript_11812/g.18173 Transcript_11812/m.18173 type:complete len:157 (+) Transcript_11812:1082-1552(+)
MRSEMNLLKGMPGKDETPEPDPIDAKSSKPQEEGKTEKSAPGRSQQPNDRYSKKASKESEVKEKTKSDNQSASQKPPTEKPPSKKSSKKSVLEKRTSMKAFGKEEGEQLEKEAGSSREPSFAAGSQHVKSHMSGSQKQASHKAPSEKEGSRQDPSL